LAKCEYVGKDQSIISVLTEWPISTEVPSDMNADTHFATERVYSCSEVSGRNAVKD